jgi:hypothetical protein
VCEPLATFIRNKIKELNKVQTLYFKSELQWAKEFKGKQVLITLKRL